ncbi:hypothetical protein ABE10_31645 [Bacillus toyonensis]|nr:hypothetical protein [Bacillus toyonensis]
MDVDVLRAEVGGVGEPPGALQERADQARGGPCVPGRCLPGHGSPFAGDPVGVVSRADRCAVARELEGGPGGVAEVQRPGDLHDAPPIREDAIQAKCLDVVRGDDRSGLVCPPADDRGRGDHAILGGRPADAVVTLDGVRVEAVDLHALGGVLDLVALSDVRDGDARLPEDRVGIVGGERVEGLIDLVHGGPFRWWRGGR